MEPKIYKKMAALEDSHWWFVARRRIIDTLITNLVLPDKAAIFEAGCGTGGNLVIYRTQSYDFHFFCCH